jgi:hypothetical protein
VARRRARVRELLPTLPPAARQAILDEQVTRPLPQVRR